MLTKADDGDIIKSTNKQIKKIHINELTNTRDEIKISQKNCMMNQS